ncbi:MAG: hypothetical protein ACLPVY_16335 [Acidimicrobiia bacterium]
MRRRIGMLVAVASVGAGLLVATPANAGTLDFGPPGQPGIGNFAPITLNGTPELTSVSIDPFSVVDSTGSGAGWNVDLTVSDLVSGGSVIPASSMSMGVPIVAPADGASMTGVVGHATTGNLSSGEKIVTADVGDGEGSYLVSPAILTLTIPPDAAAGSYAATATIAVVSGP